VSLIDELNQQVRDCNAKVETHLEAQVSAMVTTANVCITLATALAAGIAILARDASPLSVSAPYFTVLAMAAVFAVGSLVAGVLVYIARAAVSRRAVLMWEAPKSIALRVLADGEGDEVSTGLLYADALPEVASTLSAMARRYEKAVDQMVLFMSAQVASLAVSVVASLVSALMLFAR
jgi:hypothetical protein